MGAIHARTRGIRGRRGKSPGWELCSRSPKLPGEVSLCYPDLAERKGSVPAAPVCGAGAGEAPHVAGQTLALEEAAAAWSPSKMHCREGCCVLGGSCTLSVPPPVGWEGAAASHGAASRGRCWVSLSLCVWWFLGACTRDMSNTSCPILPLWA